MNIRWKSMLGTAGIILAGGLLRLPVEHSYTGEMQAAQLLEKPLELSLRDELGQSAFLAILGGFRGAVANFTALEAMDAWQQANWGVVDSRYALCNKLQPRESSYWDERAWHAGTNAPHNFGYRTRMQPGMREMRIRQHQEHAIEVLREAIQHCPESYTLYDRLGQYLGDDRQESIPDYTAAYEAFKRGAECRQAPAFMARRADYALARVPGRELEAWRALLKGYYATKLQRYAQLLATLEPVVRRLDPSALLPAEVSRHAEALRAAEVLQRSKFAPPPPVISTPSLPSTAPGYRPPGS